MKRINLLVSFFILIIPSYINSAEESSNDLHNEETIWSECAQPFLLGAATTIASAGGIGCFAGSLETFNFGVECSILGCGASLYFFLPLIMHLQGQVPWQTSLNGFELFYDKKLDKKVLWAQVGAWSSSAAICLWAVIYAIKHDFFGKLVS